MVIVLFRRQHIFLIINVILKFYTVLLVNKFVNTFGVKFAYVALVACIYICEQKEILACEILSCGCSLENS